MEPTTQSPFTPEQEAVILKGIASQLLQMSKPIFGHLQTMLEDFNIQNQVSGSYQYTADEVHRALLMCAIITNGIKKKEGQSFGDRTCEILHFALNHNSAIDAIEAMNEK